MRQCSANDLYMGAAVDVYAEGALIFPAVKVQENYKDIADIVRMCELRIRVPDQWKGDFLAMVGSARIGERETLELGREIGWDKLTAFAAQWFDHCEGQMAARIAEVPGGRATASSTHDPDSRYAGRWHSRCRGRRIRNPKKDASSSICATTSMHCRVGLT